MKTLKMSSFSIKATSFFLIFFVISTASLCFLGVTITVMNSFNQETRDHSIRHISESTKSILNEKKKNLLAQTLLVSKLPLLQSLVETKDVPTILDGIQSLKEKIKYPIFDIYLGDGSAVIHSDIKKSSAISKEDSDFLRKTHSQDYTGRIVHRNGMQAFVVGVPIGIRQFKTGFLSVGFYLDDSFSNELKKITNADIVFFNSLSGKNNISSAENLLVHKELFDFSLDNIAETHNLVEFGIKSPENFFEPLKDSLIRYLLGTWLVIFISLSFLGILFSNFLTRPIRLLNEGTQKIIESGDLKSDIHVSGFKEIQNLSTNFSTLLHKISSREKELFETSMKLAQSAKMASLGTMGASVAHELNNPLSVVMTYMEIAKKQHPDDKDLNEILDKVIYACNRMRKIIDNLLVFSRRPEEYGYNMHPLDLNRLIKNLMVLFEIQLKEKNIKLELNLEANLPKSFGDQTELESIFQNLVANARDALNDCPSDHLKMIRIASCLKENKFLCITVSDTAKGMSPETVKKIFEPFFTTKKSGSGTGLGLALTFGIIERHKGKISVHSEVDKGTSFTVELPTYQEPASSPQESEETSHA